jgi:hypothetical protein
LKGKSALLLNVFRARESFTPEAGLPSGSKTKPLSTTGSSAVSGEAANWVFGAAAVGAGAAAAWGASFPVGVAAAKATV